MVPTKPFSNAPWLLGWDLGNESLWYESGPGRLLLSLIISSPVVEGILGHHTVRARWPWTASAGLTIAASLILGLALWSYWFLLRRTRQSLVPALQRGEKGYFHSATKVQRRLFLGLWLGLGVASSHYHWPFDLMLLGAFPWMLVKGYESVRAYGDVTRAGFDLREGALRSKLAPHFIFNTLNTLHAQIAEDPRAAQTMTEKLALLFRKVLAVADRPTIPLKEELAFVESYLGIEQARLGDRLRVVIEVPDELEAEEVPPLSLQVLVENAIKHGVAPREQGGEVRIAALRQAGSLLLWVEDPGPGFSSQQGTGTALATLRQRLEKHDDLTMEMLDGRHRVSFQWRNA
jgi:two-component sensor histidine kinase